jgi:uncharacterized protein YndB with AHSA1/START domain
LHTEKQIIFLRKKFTMETAKTTAITVIATVKAPIAKVWEYWTAPEHIIKWNNPSEDWYTPKAQNDVKPGGQFNFRMEARDGSQGFDFGGVYDKVKQNELLEYTIADGRKVVVIFKSAESETKVVETFDAEGINPVEMQRRGWQAILDSFQKYTEAN